MGWWHAYDQTIIGDEMADIVGDSLNKLVGELRERWPEITAHQILHTIAFCGGVAAQSGGPRSPLDSEPALEVMPLGERRKWAEEHEVTPPDSEMVAPGTELMNANNPFADDHGPSDPVQQRVQEMERELLESVVASGGQVPDEWEGRNGGG